VLPHGIDQDYFKPSQTERSPETLLFSGKMSFHANIAAVLLLVKEIMPLIWQARPGVRLIIAGSNPPAKIRHLARNRLVEITGYQPDLRPFIEQAQIAVCPLPYAVGIQNKILEAMALGTPIVASSQAAAGLQVRANHDLLIADSPRDFAEAVLHLLADRQLWTKLAMNGQEYIARQHNWQKITQQLNTVYAGVVSALPV
jgi:glycosyltransferase involved in cell wall biosynthesis